MAAGTLGRLVPPDWEHVEKHPLTAEHKAAIVTPQEVVAGVNWYPECDTVEQDSQGHWWMARNGISPRSQRRGGHAFCLKARGKTDWVAWWDWYNQLDEGICVSEAVSRAQTQANRKMYQPRWLYDRCKERDGDPTGEGTYVRTGLEVAKDLGLVLRRRGETAQDLKPHDLDGRKPSPAEGISAFRWIRSVDDCLQVLGYGGLDYVDILNSWGRDFPHITRMPVSVLARLWQEDGELGVVTDR